MHLVQVKAFIFNLYSQIRRNFGIHKPASGGLYSIPERGIY